MRLRAVQKHTLLLRRKEIMKLGCFEKGLHAKTRNKKKLDDLKVTIFPTYKIKLSKWQETYTDI